MRVCDPGMRWDAGLLSDISQQAIPINSIKAEGPVKIKRMLVSELNSER